MDKLKENPALGAGEDETEGMTAAAEDETEGTEVDLVLKFAKPYKFNGEEYTEVDLSGLENVTAGVLENVGKIFGKKNPGANPALMEMNMQYCILLAQRVSKLPLEFFHGLPAREAVKLKTLVTNFLYGGDGED